MTIRLTDELEELINEKVKSGAYQSADEVIMVGLRLLEAREKGMEALRRKLMRGVIDIHQGRFATYETDSELDGLSNRLSANDAGKV